VSVRRILFLDRDGTLVVEPADKQVDRYEKLALVPGVVLALRRLVDAGYELVMVSNQDGLGTSSFPEADFAGPQALLIELLASQGIVFRDVFIDRSFAHEGRDTRKPGVGMLRGYLADDGWSRTHSAVVGDRESDMELAANLGVRGFRLGHEGLDWPGVAHLLCDRPRRARVSRTTTETRIDVAVDLDRELPPRVDTGIGFFDHMLAQLARHGGFALELVCRGDLAVDAHHTVEDCALALGRALREALDDKRGIARYGEADEPTHGGGSSVRLPMDEAVACALLDLSGRPYFVFGGTFPAASVGALPTELAPHFFRSLTEALGAGLHLSVRGENTHHMVEACFKAVGRAWRASARRSGEGVPSTKGVL
jgi:imidazoleglycerol-phosphate dehydratase/histidinol-phosphatase